MAEAVKKGDRVTRMAWNGNIFVFDGKSFRLLENNVTLMSVSCEDMSADDWQIIPVNRRLKSREEIKEFVVSTLGGWPFMTDDDVDSLVDIFKKVQWKPVGQRPEFCKKEAEPRVLTADEWLESRNYEVGHGLYYTLNDVIDTFNAGHQNGRLERDLELRPLLDAFAKYENNLGDYDSRNELVKAYCNLKPLNQE